MLERFFITGTDTSVGKTVVSRALLQALASQGKTVAGYKPVAKGSKETPEGLRNKDALVLQSVSTIELPYEAVNPIALSEEESSVAHSCPINYTLISNGLANLTDKVDHVVVEGTGGWRSLMNDLRPLSEWVVQEQLPVLMVVGIQEGCINHAFCQPISNKPAASPPSAGVSSRRQGERFVAALTRLPESLLRNNHSSSSIA